MGFKVIVALFFQLVALIHVDKGAFVFPNRIIPETQTKKSINNQSIIKSIALKQFSTKAPSK
jgi:hypothetical protein